ncbi:MAG TPA: DUF349 domain-containing protein [Candidatus Polarisedimenticolia bacterium]|nr:DUF349 domain-containing protein [Candidatus Polarisedimenticolia bacterium]
MGLLERLRPTPVWKDPDPQVRRSALRRLGDPAILSEVWRTDPDETVRGEAASALLALALTGSDEAAGAAAAGALQDPKLIVQIARSALFESVGRAALSRIDDLKALGSIARHGRHAATRLEAQQRLVDLPASAATLREELRVIALKSPHDDAALTALEHLTGSERFALPGEAAVATTSATSDAEFLGEVAGHGKSAAVVRRAQVLLREHEEAASGRPVGPRTDRRSQLRMCDAAEALARSSECEPLAERIAAAQDAWIDLVPNVDDDLDERFQAAIASARERLKANLAERDQHRKDEEQVNAFRERHVVPRQALIASLETIDGEDTPRLLDDACWEWNRLDAQGEGGANDPVEATVLDEARALSRRFDEVRKACQCRYEKWLHEREESRRREEQAAARRDSEKKKRDLERTRGETLERLQKLCERSERLLKAERLTLKKAEPALREVRAAIDDLPPLPSRRDHDKILERLKAIRAGLTPRVQELREGEKWMRWANTNVQEELCARAEALREIADPEAAARPLPDLMERWKTAAVAEPDKSQALWLRFKAATDETRARLEALHAQNAAGKVALCEKAEALAGSTDWTKAAEAIKALQTEWKSVGQAGRGQDKALWERFRKACDRFFTSRDEDRARRKDEWTKNLQAKEALCERAEALADSTDWKATAAAIKELQVQWKGIGQVRPNRSDSIWRRFRAACDRFFERYKRRDQIDRDTNVSAREALCQTLEGAVPGADLRPTIESAWERWQKCPPLPREHATPLLERFHRALDAAIAAHPDTFKGSAFDAEANRARLEELCARLERLLAGPAGGADESMSPATRLATLWREAMASNTIGGKVAEETKNRAAAEEVRKVQAAWQSVGYVPDTIRRPLTERYDRAYRRLRPKLESDASVSSRRPAASGRR